MSSNHSAEFYKALNYSTTEFDKSIVFIASGALGISMAFIDKIVKLSCAHDKGYLIASWFLFGATIFISLVTHFISVMANRWAILNCPNDENNTDNSDIKYRRGEKRWNSSIRILNILMIITLLIGIVLFLLFINNNLIN